MKFKSKLCSRCGKKFIPTNNAQKYCKKCREIVQKQQTKGWREAHAGYTKQYIKKWYKAHSEQIKLQNKRWGETHPEQVKQYMKKWREAHPGYFKHKSH
jgi:ribosomal protein S27AE